MKLCARGNSNVALEVGAALIGAPACPLHDVGCLVLWRTLLSLECFVPNRRFAILESNIPYPMESPQSKCFWIV